MHSFNSKQAHAQKQIKIFKLYNQHSKVYQNTFNTYPKQDKKTKNSPLIFKKTNFG